MPSPPGWQNHVVSRFVVEPSAVDPERVAAEGQCVFVAFSPQNGSERLEQSLLRLAPGHHRRQLNRRHQEVLYVASGSGTFVLDGREHVLEPDAGVLALPGEAYEIEAEEELELVSVLAPADGEIERRRVVSRFAECEEGRADENRTFRVLHDGELTQFVGLVEPCRAPDHSHPYDEVGYIVEGEGVAHIGGDRVPLRAGSCFYLPPGCVHCIENTGPGVMRIMGVFHPAGSPKQRSYDAAGS